MKPRPAGAALQALRIVTGAAFGLTLLGSTGCSQLIASQAFNAPNQSRLVQAFSGPDRQAHPDAQTLRIDVPGPPPASLHVEIYPPFPTPTNTPATQLAVPQPTTPPTLLLLHGYSHSSREDVLARWILAARQQGYRVVVPDLRGHGRSTGDYITFGQLEAQDLRHLLTALQRQHHIPDPTRLVVLGGSYGGATAIHLASIDPRVDALVTLGAYADPAVAIDHFARSYAGPLLWLTPKSWIHKPLRHRLASRSAGVIPAQAAERITIPWLIIHGTRDTHIPPRDAFALLNAHPREPHLKRTPPPRTLLLFPEDHWTLAWRPFDILAPIIFDWLRKTPA